MCIDMSDFSETIKLFAKATAGTVLPLEAMDEAKAELAEKRKGWRTSKAARANPTHKVQGRLVFAATAGDAEPRPLPHMKVELWDRDLGGSDWLGEVQCGVDGRFEITYDPADAGRFDAPDFELRIVDTYAGRDTVLAIHEGPDNVETAGYDFGDVPVVYYEYHPDIPLPHLYTLEFGKQEYDAMPQDYAVGRKLALAKVARATMAVRLGHYTIDREVELEDIQADYRGKTGYEPPVTPGPDASAEERFIDKLLNGTCPTDFAIGPDVNGEEALHVIRNWDLYDLDGVHDLPNVHLVLRREGEGLRPVSLTIQRRANGAKEPGSELAPAETFSPSDEGWPAAQHVFECVNYIYSQAANHLARGHFNAEQFALAAFRNLHESPLTKLLFPHLKEVMIINVEGERAIFGPDGLITKNGALTETSLVEAILHAAGGVDWFEWKPREPLTAGHRYAHVAQLMWEALTEHVDAFFVEHLDGILEHWREVRGFSKDLAEHSVPYRPWSGELPEGLRPLDMREVAKPEAPRVEVDGVVRVATPVVHQDGEPDAADLGRLAQACRYAIFHASFFHSWVNDTSDSLEASYSQYNPVPGSSPKELTNHISTNLTLSQTRYGMIMRNEDGDVPRSLIEALRSRAEAFAAHDYDIRQIRARINI
ncbi:hypothetical protein PPSIR1_20739 [Plesiocystis pacifica SIR-1]|uniref:Lipoxygenase domain-containing protein n=2 Tax=Plesiocystis pacifica TaxID=191768 RepID=A6G2C4_9BACT|nr:hypothetical protein PPSIR1_20739 [Plesiocystis pacifica SIR-1]